METDYFAKSTPHCATASPANSTNKYLMVEVLAYTADYFGTSRLENFPWGKDGLCCP